MLNIIISLCIQNFAWSDQMWKSTAPWKEGLSMDDPYYLPIFPIFTLVTPNNFKMDIIGDLLTIRSTQKFKPAHYLHQLNTRVNPNKTLTDLHRYCEKDNISQACLILGRIYEFGSYNQTEDQSLAYRYYLKVRALNDSFSNGILSFYHRYYDYDIQASIVEADYSLKYNFVETMLSTANQLENGLTRPLSCPAAAHFLLRIADTTSKMKYFPQTSELNETEIARMSNSSDPLDLYHLAMHELSVPYPSDSEIRTAKKRLKTSLTKGNKKAAAPIAKLYISQKLNNQKSMNISYVSNLLNEGINLDDPAAMVTFADFLSLFNKDQSLRARKINELLSKSADLGYPPAIYMLGVLTYFGYNGIPRSNTKGFKYFTKAAAKGYLPAMFNAAEQLIGGDGVIEDCTGAVSMLRRIIDFGPWATYLDKFVNRGSKHAFIKMLDMNLTPSAWVNISNATNILLHNDNNIGLGRAQQKIGDAQDIENKQIDTLSFLLKTSDQFISNEHGPTFENRIKRIRKAREGDGSSLIWLSLMSPLSESVQWLDRMKLLPSPSCHLASVIQAFVASRGCFDYFTGELKQQDIDVLKKLLEPYIPKLFIFLTTIVLMIFLYVRVTVLFSE